MNIDQRTRELAYKILQEVGTSNSFYAPETVAQLIASSESDEIKRLQEELDRAKILLKTTRPIVLLAGYPSLHESIDNFVATPSPKDQTISDSQAEHFADLPPQIRHAWAGERLRAESAISESEVKYLSQVYEDAISKWDDCHAVDQSHIRSFALKAVAAEAIRRHEPHLQKEIDDKSTKLVAAWAKNDSLLKVVEEMEKALKLTKNEIEGCGTASEHDIEQALASLNKWREENKP